MNGLMTNLAERMTLGTDGHKFSLNTQVFKIIKRRIRSISVAIQERTKRHLGERAMKYPEKRFSFSSIQIDK